MVRQYEVILTGARVKPRSVQAAEGALIADVIKAEGIKFSFPCNGLGTCGKCRVIARHENIGATNPPTPSELLYLGPAALEAGVRLACQTKVLGPVTLEFPELLESGSILTAGNFSLEQADPLWNRVVMQAPDPLNWDDISGNIKEDLKPGLDVLQELSEIQGVPEKIAVEMLGDRVIALTSGEDLPRRFAVAVDIGTTTLATYLVDFESGRIVKTASTMNPQGIYGADLISRIQFAGQPDGLKKLHALIIGALNELVDELASKAAISHDDILQINLSGNTCMIHLLLNISPASLGGAPFTPVFRDSLTLKPVELGLKIRKSGLVNILPGIGGFVGADIAAGLLACKMKPDKYELFIDIGTNAEVVITGKGKILACSTAAGPAFEGAKIACGMPAKAGAIIDYQFTENGPIIATIDNTSPAGICGTGLIRILVALLKKGIITETGRFDDEIDDANFDTSQKRYYLVRREENPIFISQQDIREFQLAKAAIRAGLEIMMRRLEVSAPNIEKLYLAGAFGTYLKPEDAIFLGLLPEIPVERIFPAGNTAGIGTVISALSNTAFKNLNNLVKKIEHVELATDPAFTETFTEAMFFNI